MNCYMIEFINLDGCYQYETFLAEDQHEAIDQFKKGFTKCEPYAVFMQLHGWDKNEHN